MHGSPTTKELKKQSSRLILSRCTETKKYGPNERPDQNPEKELSDEEIDNLSNAEFKTRVIRMLTELIEVSHKMKEEMKDIQSEIKENIQGTNIEEKESGTPINDLEQKEEISIQTEQNEETRMKKK